MFRIVNNAVNTNIRILNRRCVATWSPLTSVFNSLPKKKRQRDEVGLFINPTLKSFKGFYTLKEDAQRRTDQLIEEALSKTRKRKMVTIFDELSDTLCKVADLAEFIRLAHPNETYSNAAENACITISGIVERLNTHKTLYQALKHVVESGDIMETSIVDNHVAKLFLFDFEQSGIHLEERHRQRVVHLNDLILQTGQKFMVGSVSPRIVNRDILPTQISSYFQSEAGGKLTISGLCNDSDNNVIREAAYRMYLYPDVQQEKLLKNLLEARHELATLCGFKTYAERALKASIVENPKTVLHFLDVLNKDIGPKSEKDFKIMQKMKQSEFGGSAKLACWDVPYYTAAAKRKILNSSSMKEISQYFSLGACMEGLNQLFYNLFNINLIHTDMEPGESWSPDVYKLTVVHKVEGTLGYIYCDFFERDEKPNQDCHFTIQGGKILDDGSYQSPIVVVMLNFTKNRWTGPTLLSPAMLDNLFHEMGHAMHSMLGRTEHQHVTGTRCCTDLAEVPSILMEYFSSDPRVLKTFARHYSTNEIIPDNMLNFLCSSKYCFSASETQLQLFYSALDQYYHSEEILSNDTTSILKNVQEKYYSLPYVDKTAWQLRFSHLVGYGAKYYSYLISKAIASWIWRQYFEKDPFNRNQGEKYRQECLSYGGSIQGKLLVSQFLGHEVTPENLAKSIISELDCYSKYTDKLL